ncbi:MAG TPA: hypothetical protein VF680_05625, partial [Allosphingosinicella sp.]
TFGRVLEGAAMPALGELLAGLGEEAEVALLAQGVDPEAVVASRRAALRYEGSDSALEVPVTFPAQMRQEFEALHKARFGFEAPETAVVIETAVVEALGRSSPGFPGEGDQPKAGGGAERSEEERLRLRLRRPSTALRAVPLPRKSGGGFQSE